MRYARQAALAAALMVFGSLAGAQELPFKNGDAEIGFFAQVNQESYEAEADVSGPNPELADEDSTTFTVTGNYGYFLTAQHELIVTGGVSWIKTDDDDESFGRVGVGYDFNVPSAGSPIVPVIGAAAQTTVFGDIEGYTYGVSGGVRVLVGEAISINTRVYAEHTHREQDSGIGFDVLEDFDDIGIRCGFSWILR